MDTKDPEMISMQDMRTRLAEITNRTEGGESFVVIRNSKPVFRIEPLSISPNNQKARADHAVTFFDQLDEKHRQNPSDITLEDVVQMVREVREEVKALDR